MHKLTFYPLGNADTCKIDLSDGQKLLFDYAHLRDNENEEDLRADLEKLLREDLEAAGRDYFDVVAFTHADTDHIKRASEFFFLEHASKYQGDERIKIKELWVPAAMIIEEGLKDDARVLRSEARYRLKNGFGIRVFSRPERLKDWFEEQGIAVEERSGLITNAGQTVPGFNKDRDGVEFFVHSPFALRDGEELEDRNESSLILHITLICKGRETKFLLIGDSTHDALANVVNITKYHHREERLEWDIYDIPHHCSYLALSDEKRAKKTIPAPEVKWLLDQGSKKGVLVSSSNPIPNDYENPQPPHKQAASCYEDIEQGIDGRFKVTMEHPTVSKPEPLVITIDEWGAKPKLIISGGGSATTSRPAPRAGILNDAKLSSSTG
ncbi:MAG: hypothetical protein WBD99_08115 [Thermodesulfobacteriota bacterium]